jgi:hypothetical protein
LKIKVFGLGLANEGKAVEKEFEVIKNNVLAQVTVADFKALYCLQRQTLI